MGSGSISVLLSLHMNTNLGVLRMKMHRAGEDIVNCVLCRAFGQGKSSHQFFSNDCVLEKSNKFPSLLFDMKYTMCRASQA